MANQKKPVNNEPAAAALVVVEAIEPIRHDGLDVEPGECFAVSPEQAASLVDAGVATIPEVDAAK